MVFTALVGLKMKEMDGATHGTIETLSQSFPQLIFGDQMHSQTLHGGFPGSTEFFIIAFPTRNLSSLSAMKGTGFNQ